MAAYDSSVNSNGVSSKLSSVSLWLANAPKLELCVAHNGVAALYN